MIAKLDRSIDCYPINLNAYTYKEGIGDFLLYRVNVHWEGRQIKLKFENSLLFITKWTTILILINDVKIIYKTCFFGF